MQIAEIIRVNHIGLDDAPGQLLWQARFCYLGYRWRKPRKIRVVTLHSFSNIPPTCVQLRRTRIKANVDAKLHRLLFIVVKRELLWLHRELERYD